MDEEDVIVEKPIGAPEMIFVLSLVGAEEFVEFIILAITLGTGIIVVEIMNGAMAALIEIYMLFRGGRGVLKLIVEPIGAFINGATASLAPGKTIATMVGIWAINHSEVSDALNVVGGKGMKMPVGK